MNYYNYNENSQLTCPHCGWIGKAKDGSIEYFDQMMTIDCPNCLDDHASLLAIEYPTPEETKTAAKTGNKEAMQNLPVALYTEKMLNLTALAKKLVTERIPGFRKGTSDVPAYIHSINVADSLQKIGCTWDVHLAGLLHDIVEDGDTSLQELKRFGFSDRTIELVDLCSHDKSVQGGDARWVKMIARLVERNDQDAWVIKLADILDNLRSCHTMPEDRQRFMKETKAPLMLKLTEEQLSDLPIWQELENQCQILRQAI